MMAPFKRTHGFQELDSLKAADYSSQTALALSRGNGQHCGDELRGARLFDHGSPLRRLISSNAPFQSHHLAKRTLGR